MKYTCMNCGSSAHKPSELCNPSTEHIEGTFCATATDSVCDDRLSSMKFQCSSCGGLSPEAEHLCDPKEI